MSLNFVNLTPEKYLCESSQSSVSQRSPTPRSRSTAEIMGAHHGEPARQKASLRRENVGCVIDSQKGVEEVFEVVYNMARVRCRVPYGQRRTICASL
jgi:hypothetical protein